jgi:hypothetical protein
MRHVLKMESPEMESGMDDLMSEPVPPQGDVWPLVERRHSDAGRRTPASFSAIFTFRPRRRCSRGRRKTDPAAYVDRYDARSWGIAVAVLALSLLDTVLTQFHLEMGTAEEANPVMRAVLDAGGYPAFYAAKIIMTILPIIVIMLHKEWPFGKYAARFCLWAYILLACWHAFLLIYLR